MGNWVTISQAGASGFTPPPDAPNITGASCSAYYGMFGNASAFGLQGTITLPTGDPNYSHLKEIDIAATLPNGSSVAVQVLYDAWIGSTVTFKSPCTLPQVSTSTTVPIIFTVKNDIGLSTPSPVTVNVTVQASAVASISSAGEIGTRFIQQDQNNRLVYMTVGFVPAFVGAQLPQYETHLVSNDNGSTWTHLGPTLITSVGQQVKIVRPAPGTNQTWKVASAAGFLFAPPSGFDGIPDASLSSFYPGVVRSSGFSVATLGLPSASLVTLLSVTAPGSGSWPYNATRPDDGSQYWLIPQVSFIEAGDANTFFWRVTVQSLDASHGFVGVEKPFFGQQDSGLNGSQSASLDGDYVTGIAYQRFRLYACNRIDQSTNSFMNPLCAVLQTGVGGGTGHVDVLVAAGGALPTGTLKATRFDPATLGPGLVQDAITGKPKLNSTNLANMVLNFSFEDGLTGYLAPGAVLQTGSGSITGTNRLQLPPGIYVREEQLHTCRQGDTYNAQCYIASDTGASSAGRLFVEIFDGSGVGITGIVLDSHADTGGNFVLIKGNFTIPALGSFFRLGADGQTSTGNWYVDDFWLTQQTSGGSGTQPDGNGGLALKYGAALKDDGTGAAAVAITGPFYTDISNNLNIRIASDFVVSGGVLTQNIINLAKAVNFDSSQFSVGGGFMTIGALGVNKLIAGDALFAGQATFAYSGGGKVTINSSGITLADSNTFPTTTATIAPSGISLVKGTNSVQITSAGVSIFGPVGSFTATSGGIVISNGSSSVSISSSAVTIAQGAFSFTSGSVTVNIDSTNRIKLTDTSSNKIIIIDGSGVTVKNSSNPSIVATMNETQIFMADGSGNSTTFAVGQISLNGPGGTLSLFPFGIKLNGVSYTHP